MYATRAPGCLGSVESRTGGSGADQGVRPTAAARVCPCRVGYTNVHVRLYLTPMDVGDITIIEAAGRITLGENVEAIRDLIHQLTARGRHKILLNLAEVTYIDSSGIGEMVSAYTTLSSLGGAMKLLKLTKR